MLQCAGGIRVLTANSTVYNPVTSWTTAAIEIQELRKQHAHITLATMLKDYQEGSK